MEICSGVLTRRVKTRNVVSVGVMSQVVSCTLFVSEDQNEQQQINVTATTLTNASLDDCVLHIYDIIIIILRHRRFLRTRLNSSVMIYRMSQDECARLREGVPYVKVYRYNPKHLCPK